MRKHTQSTQQYQSSKTMLISFVISIIDDGGLALATIDAIMLATEVGPLNVEGGFLKKRVTSIQRHGSVLGHTP